MHTHTYARPHAYTKAACPCAHTNFYPAEHVNPRQAIAKAVEGANRIYLTAHGHIAIVGQAALRARAHPPTTDTLRTN